MTRCVPSIELIAVALDPRRLFVVKEPEADADGLFEFDIDAEADCEPLRDCAPRK